MEHKNAEKNYSLTSYIELFHLIFLKNFSQKVDQRLYAIKGGCNLRFFLNSIRYSEDLDIDIHTISIDTLKNTVEKILSSNNFIQTLRIKALEIVSFSAPKQTTTTQRWKITLKINNNLLPLNTKIEFSRRAKLQDTLFEMPQKYIMQYNLPTFFLSHYPAHSALKQKIHALIARTETQARDVFDIYHLIQYCNIAEKFLSLNELKTATDNAMSINFDIFKAQVITYLEPDYQPTYDNAATWDMIVLTVIEHMNHYLIQ